MSDKATARPWKRCYARRHRGGHGYSMNGADGRPVIYDGGIRLDLDAELIERAINSHDDLVTAFEESLKMLEDPDFGHIYRASEKALNKWRLALAKAKGEQPDANDSP